MKEKIKVALGTEKADLVIKNALVLNVFTEKFEKINVAIKDGEIAGLGDYSGKEEIDLSGKAIVPGFVDGHMHLESALISPRQFAFAVSPHGTTSIVADPHEITNVSGITGFNYILKECENLPIDVYLTVPSCVPATPFDESGAVIKSKDIYKMLKKQNVLGLAELMNYPGVLSLDHEVLKKLKITNRSKKVTDGHAPKLSGKELNAYITAGAMSDHECTYFSEAVEKLSRGQWIMIREGTASKDLEALLPLFEKPYSDRCMLVTDDRHPGDLLNEGHIDNIIRKAILLGASAVNAYKMASFNASKYFNLSKNGAIAPGYRADFVVLDDVNSVKIHSVYKNGKAIDSYNKAVSKNPYSKKVKSTINIKKITPDSFKLKKDKEKVIGLVPGEILTTDEGYAQCVDIKNDVLKLSVIERHKGTGNIGVAFVKGYGLKQGAIATSVSHDSHNIIAVGANDSDMALAVSRIKALEGGMVVVNKGEVLSELALPIAGLMCDLTAKECGALLSQLKDDAYQLGVNKNIDPFMTLSFASLAVVPKLRLTTKGVVDVESFKLL